MTKDLTNPLDFRKNLKGRRLKIVPSMKIPIGMYGSFPGGEGMFEHPVTDYVRYWRYDYPGYRKEYLKQIARVVRKVAPKGNFVVSREEFLQYAISFFQQPKYREMFVTQLAYNSKDFVSYILFVRRLHGFVRDHIFSIKVLHPRPRRKKPEDPKQLLLDL